MKIRNDRGSMMMESVLILPIFVLIIFFLIQMTFVWVAKQMTYYAAYCGARAALVYNPADYNAEKSGSGWSTGGPIRKGVVHHAACIALSWVSWSLSGYDLSGGKSLFYLGGKAAETVWNIRVGTYSVPLSANVRNQVTVETSEYEAISDGNSKPASGSSKSAEADIGGQFPAVTVKVTFKCPLFIPLGGPLIAYFFGAGQSDAKTDGAISTGGFTAPDSATVQAKLQQGGNYTNSGSWEYYSIVLEESCTMAKPYKTDTFPLMPDGDKTLMGMAH